MPATDGAYLDVGSTKIWYQECGAANGSTASVVLLHDGLLHSVTWDGIWEPLCAKYHVVRYDRRGYGRSEPPKERFVPEDDLYKIMRQVKMDRAVLMGNSSGAGLALDFALAHAQMVDGLFLVGPVVHGMPSSGYFNERGNKNSAPLAHDDVKAAAENWSKDPFLIGGDDPSARKTFYDNLLQAPQNLKFNGGMEIRPLPPTVRRLSQIQAPTLVVVGERDIADVFAYAGAIEAALPVVSFQVWKNLGHLVQLQAPAELVTHFDNFVPLVERREVSLPMQLLQTYIGNYKFFDSTVGVTIKGDRLSLAFSDGTDYLLFASSDSRFFLRTAKAEVEFQKDNAGKVNQMIIHNSDSSDIKCHRTTAQPAM